MISPTRYNLNFFIFFPLSFQGWGGGTGWGGDRLLKKDSFGNAPIFPLDVISIPSIFAASVFSLAGFWCFLVSPPFTPPCVPPDTLSDDIESSHFLLCVYVRIPALCFHWAAFHGRQGFLILGSRQRWQKQPGQSQSEPGSHPAIQSVAAVKPQQLPGGAHYTGEISNHESFTPVLPCPPLS